MDIKPYVQVKDQHGAVASIYFLDDQNHEVHYFDNTNTKFFTEQFAMMPIELVERYVVDWAKGKRELAI
jgi:hypothetical protein